MGGFAAVLPTGQPVEVSGKKNRALLTYLALHADKKLTREKLIGLLWSDRGEAQARNSLRQALAALRRDLSGIEPPPLTIDGDTVVLVGAAVSTDVGAFEELAASASADQLRQAAKLYEGDLLDGLAVRDPAFDDWLTFERSRLREAAIGALTRLMAYLTATEAITTGQRLVALDPLREASHQALMHAYAAQGQFEQAIRQHHYCRDTLRRELDVVPSAKMESLYQEIREGLRQPATASAEAGEPTSPRSERPSIAVLPFENRSDDPRQRYFADGITEDIITELSRFSSLLVIARNSSFRYRDRSLDMKRIGRELRAHYLVEGSVRRRGPQIRITAQLIDAVTDRHLWAERYNCSFDNLFEIQDEVVRAVVTTSEHRIADTEAEQIHRMPPQSWIAYDYILQARQQLARYGGYLEAEAPLRRAIELDPKLAEAYSRLAHVAMGKYWLKGDDSCLDEAWSFACKALAINDNDSSAHAAMAIVSAFMNRFDLAWLHSNRALALNPNNCTAAINHAALQFSTGKHSEALATLDLVLQRDPFPNPTYWEARGGALFQLKRYQEAIDAFGLIPEPQFWERAYVIAALAHSEQLEEAGRQFMALRELHPDITISRVLKTDIAQGEARNHLIEGLRKVGMPAGALDI
jgi:TolB-like protein/Flp pilus assembly protein TadD